MADLALKCMNESDQEQRDTMLHLRTQTLDSLKKTNTRKASHFGKLPFEISSAIFILAVGEDVFGAFTISHVCKAWRGIALNTPALWKSVVIRHNRDIPKAGVVLKRANGNVKRLEIHSDFGLYQKNFLVRHAHDSFWDRLETLALIYDADPGVFRNFRFEFTLWEFIPWEKLRLQSFILSSVSYSWPAGQFWEAINRMTHCTIRTVTFKGPVLPSSHFEQYGGLTRLQINYPRSYPAHYSQQELASLFYPIPRLETAIIDVTVTKSTEIQRPPNKEPLAMEYLVHLESHQYGGWLDNFLKGGFSFPALQTLHLYDGYALGDYLVHLEPLAGNLVALRLSTWGPATLTSFLKASPNIVTLDLFNFEQEMSDEMDALGGRNRAPICPKLEHIHFRSCSELSGISLFALVLGRYSRARIADELKAVYVSLAGPAAMERRRSALDQIWLSAGAVMTPIRSLVIEDCDLIHPEMIKCLRTPVTRIRYKPSHHFIRQKSQAPKRREWK
ncbi:hypothetical protein BD410DRAFT_865829 [Rickenella mellea]|uniref:Uncharacterized protein n=1 Tax=Rickenella mellea TaxID=50990 RepID=A0A4Y7Q2V0_9AGAM|nr:hypothetical protein BD410DRAFT_865829 [Rickenella mellea]